MKVLWIVNQPIAHLRAMLNMPLGQSGGWMEAAYQSIKDSNEVCLGIATIYLGSELKHEYNEGHEFFAVPSFKTLNQYNPNANYNRQQWKKVIGAFKPDLIHVWGTEYPLALCVLKEAIMIPSVVYIQGMMNQIANHYNSGVSLFDQIKYTTLYDIKNWSFFWEREKKMRKVAQNESELLRLSKHVICESEWCANNCKMVAPGCRVFESLLPINSVFAEYEWSLSNMQRHSIFTVAGNYPIKGLHILLKAFALVIRQYPDARLYIPGSTHVFSTDLRGKLRKSMYESYIEKMIDKLKLRENIFFCGSLNALQMASQIAKCNVYVMPSSCENHSSSLIEAMVVGAPTISSYVGGISSYYVDGINGFFYRYDEPEVLASLICNYFQNDSLAERVANEGRKGQRESRLSINIRKDFLSIYQEILKEKK